MTEVLSTALEHLEALVGFDTRNPPRTIGTGGIFDYIAAQLPEFRIDVRNHGAGAVSLLAVRGTPSVLFNVHLDTVPDSPAWTADPLRLRVTDDRAIGLGACDIKGAAAGLLTAAAVCKSDAAFFFSSDEEANDARCIATFLAQPQPFHRVIVAEPTQCRAVVAHRGIHSVHLQFSGEAGHASAQQSREASAVHQAMRWGAAALQHVETCAQDTFGELQGLRFNIGRVEGGIKGNVIAPSADLRFNFRPLPSQASEELHNALRALAPTSAVYTETFAGPSLPAARDADAETRRRSAIAFAEQCGLPIGPAVDFWTEAALFSQAGWDAIVYGPGDIAQAHTADEWVALSQLDAYTRSIIRLLQGHVA